MKKNFPVTQREVPLPDGYLVSRTDKKGIITHVNDAFIKVSGFAPEELIGKSHNIVRHPDMPPQAFAQLWATMKAGMPWRGMVKNRCKNGDHYWVDALIVPEWRDGEIIGYMSVRSLPSRQQVDAASALYARINETGERLPTPDKKPLSHGVKSAWAAGALMAGLLALAFCGLALDWLPSPRWVGGASLLGLLIVGWQFRWRRHLLIGMGKVTRVLDSVSEGRLYDELPIGGQDERGMLFNSLITMQMHLKVMLSEISGACRRLEAGADGVRSRMGTIRQHSEEQNVAVGEIDTGMAKINDMARDMADSAGESAGAVQTTRQMLSVATQGMQQSRQASAQVVKSVDKTVQTIETLSQAIAKIGKVAEGIRHVADQTNLLALNAAIEAARAGEAGRGFAVVADEVRKLAGDTAAETEEIGRVIAEIERIVGEALVATQQAGSETGEANRALAQSDDSLGQVSQEAEGIDQRANNIVAEATEGSRKIADLSGHLSRIREDAQKNLTYLHEVNGEVDGLLDAVGVLSQMVALFRFGAGKAGIEPSRK